MLSPPEGPFTRSQPGTDRTLPLTLLLAALPLPLLAPAAARIVGGQSVYRVLVSWGLPLAALLVTAAISPEPRRGHLFGGSPRIVIGLLPWCLLALMVDLSCLGLGHVFGWITFTYGDQGLAGHPFRAMSWGLPLCLLAGFAWEWVLRRTLLVSWMARVRRPAALLISCSAGVLLATPSIVPGLRIEDPGFVAAAFLVAACREFSCAWVFVSGAGLPAAALYRGSIVYIETFLIADWYGITFPMANYNTSDPVFYAVRGVTALLAAGVMALGVTRPWRRGIGSA